MEQDKENPSGKSIVVDDRKSESEEGRSSSRIHDKEGENQELGFPISTEETMSSSSTSLQIKQEVKKEDDSSGGKQEPDGITEAGSSSSRQQDDDPNPENKDSYFEDMSGNLDVKVQLLKDCTKEKEKLELDLAVLQQCLEMEIPPEEITEEVTLKTVLILESAKEHVRLIDLKTEEIQALTQEVDTGFNISFDYYADRAESDEHNAGKQNEKVKSLSSSSTSLQIQQEVKKEDDSSGGKQVPAGITEAGSSSSRQQDDDPNPENKDSYFEDMSGNLDAKVELLKDCIKLEQDLAVLQQCLEMEIPPEEITEEVTLNTLGNFDPSLGPPPNHDYFYYTSDEGERILKYQFCRLDQDRIKSSGLKFTEVHLIRNLYPNTLHISCDGSLRPEIYGGCAVFVRKNDMASCYHESFGRSTGPKTSQFHEYEALAHAVNTGVTVLLREGQDLDKMDSSVITSDGFHPIAKIKDYIANPTEAGKHLGSDDDDLNDMFEYITDVIDEHPHLFSFVPSFREANSIPDYLARKKDTTTKKDAPQTGEEDADVWTDIPGKDASPDIVTDYLVKMDASGIPHLRIVSSLDDHLRKILEDKYSGLLQQRIFLKKMLKKGMEPKQFFNYVHSKLGLGCFHERLLSQWRLIGEYKEVQIAKYEAEFDAWRKEKELRQLKKHEKLSRRPPRPQE